MDVGVGLAFSFLFSLGNLHCRKETLTFEMGLPPQLTEL